MQPSRRTVLGLVAAAPIATQPRHPHNRDALAFLVRTKAGRLLSRDRYDSAEIAFLPSGPGSSRSHIRQALHQAGGVVKLGLCSHLLDVGFPDLWLATHIQQDIDKALSYANATGLGHDCSDMARLAVILSPYWKWGYPHLIGDPPMESGGFTSEQIYSLVRALLDHVRDVTGHACPKGARNLRGWAEPR